MKISIRQFFRATLKAILVTALGYGMGFAISVIAKLIFSHGENPFKLIDPLLFIVSFVLLCIFFVLNTNKSRN